MVALVILAIGAGAFVAWFKTDVLDKSVDPFEEAQIRAEAEEMVIHLEDHFKDDPSAER